jgi:hypothetical protein
MPTVSSPRGLRRVRSRAFAIEAALLRASVGALSADRHVCKHCHRTPLTGERVYYYDGRHGTAVVCELCRAGRALEPTRSEIVRTPATSSVKPVRP